MTTEVRKSQRIQENVQKKPIVEAANELKSPSKALNESLVQLNLEDDRIPNMANVLKNLNNSTLYQLLLRILNDTVPTNKTKNWYVTAILDRVWTVALEAFFALMSKQDKDDTISFLNLEIDYGMRGAVKTAIIGTFKANLNTFIQLLEDKYSDEQIQQFCENYDIDISVLKDRNEMVNELLHTLRFNSTSAFYNFLPANDIRAIANGVGLNATGSKVDIIMRLIAQENDDPPKTRDVNFNRPAIAQGIDYATIFNQYYAGEIQQYCKSNGIKSSGSKRELIKRILQFLDGDTTKIMTGSKEHKRRRNTDGIIKKKKKAANKENEPDPVAPKSPSKPSTTASKAKAAATEKTTTETTSVVPTKSGRKTPVIQDEEEASQEIEEPKRSRSKSSETIKKEEPKVVTTKANNTPTRVTASSTRITRKVVEQEDQTNENEDEDDEDEDEVENGVTTENADEDSRPTVENEVAPDPMDLDEIIDPSPLKPKSRQVNNEGNKKTNPPVVTRTRVMSPSKKITSTQPVAPVTKNVIPTAPAATVTTRRKVQ